jgi:hypothetical protein
MRFLLNILETAIMIFFVVAATLALTALMLDRGVDPFLVRLAGLLLIIILALNGLRRAFSRPRTVVQVAEPVEEERHPSKYMGLIAAFMVIATVAAKIRQKIQSAHNAG